MELQNVLHERWPCFNEFERFPYLCSHKESFLFFVQDEDSMISEVVKMLITIVTFFGLCWLPLHSFILVMEITNMDRWADSDLQKVLGHLYFVAHWLAMSNSFVNPIIYGFMNDNFRYDLRALLFQLSPCIIRHSRGRHKVVKKKSRGNGYQLYKYTCANTSDSCSSKDKPFGRSRTQHYRGESKPISGDVTWFRVIGHGVHWTNLFPSHWA
uniref:Neuropeptide FF receptor 2 n=1 Tax=Magallana gigas TaxID=29159 RepID=K1QS29_MAGGI